MKVTSVEYRLLALDRSLWLGDRSPEWDVEWLFPLFQFHTTDGIDGYSMGYGAAGDGRLLVAGLRDIYAPALRGVDPIRSEELWQRLRRRGRHLYSVSDAMVGIIDVAMWDLRGKLAGLPLAGLLGQFRDEVPAYATSTRFINTPEVVFEEALRRQTEGYHGYKLQIWDGPRLDIPRLRAAREAVGDGFPLMLDAAGQYDYMTALEIGRELDRLAFHWYEEPIPDRQTSLLRRLADQIQTPVVGTETVRLAELGQYAVTGAGDLLRGDVYLKGGVTGLRKALGLAEMLGLRLEIHTAANPVLDVANLHVACSTETSQFVEVHHEVFRFGLKGKPLDINANGCLEVPTGPGLGIELDWDWIDNHTVESGSII